MEKAEIAERISKHGYFNYLVLPGVCPRYSYTIGLSESLGFELILGGMSIFDAPDLHNIFNSTINILKQRSLSQLAPYNLQYGAFSLARAHGSWLELAALGALRYYASNDTPFIQILFDGSACIDDPDMSLPVTDKANGAWKYLTEEWPYNVKEESECLLDIGAIKGEKIELVSRYEDDYWEMFADSDFEYDKESAKILPISVVIEKYPHMVPVLYMEIDTQLRF